MGGGGWESGWVGDGPSLHRNMAALPTGHSTLRRGPSQKTHTPSDVEDEKRHAKPSGASALSLPDKPRVLDTCLRSRAPVPT